MSAPLHTPSLVQPGEHFATMLSRVLPRLDPAQIPEDALNKLLCEIHAAGTEIERFKTRATPALQTPTKKD